MSWPGVLAAGFTAARLGAEAASGTVLSLRCKIHFPGVTEEEQLQEVYKESEVPKLDLGIRLQPSTAPAALKLLLDGQELPIKVCLHSHTPTRPEL